jgi:type II secretory pathway component PulK
MRSRSGFALLATLLMVVALCALGFVSSSIARQSVAAAHNRINLSRAGWEASACLARTRAAIEKLLSAPEMVSEGSSMAWAMLGEAISSSALSERKCNVVARSVGTRMNINDMDAERLTSLLAQVSPADTSRATLVNSALDWRDADDDARPNGAEREWYASRNRPTPRNGPFANVRELSRVRGWDKMHLDSVLDVEQGRVDINLAASPVIASLPGFDEEAVFRLFELRARHERVEDIITFAHFLSPESQARLLSSVDELTHLITYEPDAWLITVTASSGEPEVSSVLEVRIVHSGTRAAIVRVRSWIK